MPNFDPNTPSALHFGAGNIGRGFIGKLLSEAGYNVVFTDVVAPLIEEIERRKTYQVRVVGKDDVLETVNVAGAVMSTGPEVLEWIAKVDMLTTAVGPRILERIAPSIAKGLIRRKELGETKPLTIIACENAIRATSTLKSCVLKELDEQTVEWAKKYVGFSDCAVDRIVPPARQADILGVTVEEFCEWVVDETQLLPEVKNRIASVKYTDNLDAFVERKLMTVNTGHAICAYLGRLKGYPDIRTSIADPEIEKIVKGAMLESGMVLVKRYGLDWKEHQVYVDKVLGRYANPHIFDDVTRVGREPIRKLSPQDRLIKPLSGCLEYDLPHENLVIGVAAALMYFDETDPQSSTLRDMINETGRAGVLKQLCQIDRSNTIGQIDSTVDKLTQQYQQ